MFNVIDNFLEPEYHQRLKDIILSDSFPWYFKEDISLNGKTENFYHFGFQHTVFNNDGSVNSGLSNDLLEFLMSVLAATGRSKVLRCRVDMVNAQRERVQYIPHVDYRSRTDNVSLVYYLIGSDGDTILYNEKFGDEYETLTEMKRVNPVENRLLMFSGDYMHTGEGPVEHNKRVLINLNVI